MIFRECQHVCSFEGAVKTSYHLAGFFVRKILVRWVSMTNDDGIGLLAKSFTPIEFNALEYTHTIYTQHPSFSVPFILYIGNFSIPPN